MTDVPTSPSGPRGRGRLLTAAASGLVLVLALASLFWPGEGPRRGRAVFLVFDSSLETERIDAVFAPLGRLLQEEVGHPLELVVAEDRETFVNRVAEGADFVLCPDGLAIGLDPDRYQPLVVGRRSAPRNLRPRGVLVYRKSAGLVAEPWISHPAATVFGDSLTLAATGSWRRTTGRGTRPPRPGAPCAWGPDPYDHAPALHAARLGAFNYAVVRQWDADRFFTAGLLPTLDWGVELLTVPVPDVVLLVGDVEGSRRLELADLLSGLGRNIEGESSAAASAREGLGRLGLVGFNLLVEPDFELVRRNFTAGWLPAGE